MKRREFITLIGGTAAAWPLAARAQQPARLPTIGFLGSGTISAWSPWTAAFVQRLRELGWIEGRNVAIEYRWAEGRPERYAEVAAEFVQLKPEFASRRLHLARLGLGQSAIGRVDQQGHDARRGEQLVQQFEPLRRDLNDQRGYARHVAARPVQACDEAKLDRVAARLEDNRNGCGRCLCRERCSSSGYGNHGNLALN